MKETQEITPTYIKGNGRDSFTEASYQKDISCRFGLENIIPQEEVLVEDKITPEKLYKTPQEGHFNVPDILRVRQVTNELIHHLDEALENLDDEIERETIMTYFSDDIYKLNMFLKINENFKDAICLLETAIIAQNASVYTRDKIIALQKFLEIMRNNIYMNNNTLDNCFDILEDAEFDLNAPMGDIDFAA